MAERKLFAGARLKRLRKGLKLTQSKMAEELGVSASYLNLMERNQRPVTAQVLIRLVETYDLDLGVFAAEPDQRAVLDLREAASDPALQLLGLDEADIKELLDAHPLGAQALVRMHKAYRNLSQTHAGLAERMSDDGAAAAGVHSPEDVVREIVQETEGHFADIEEAAALFRDEIRITQAGGFHELSARLQQLHSVRTRILPQDVMGTLMRRYDRHSRRLLVSELLDGFSRSFQLAIQIGHLELRDLLDEYCLDPRVVAAGRPAAENMREELARRFAAAVLLPYDRLLEAAQETGYDLVLLSRQFGCGMDVLMRRLASLRQSGQTGIPFFFLRIDRAGQLVERGGARNLALSRVGGPCPIWPLWQASSGTVVPHTVTMPDNTHLLLLSGQVQRVVPGTPARIREQVIVLGCNLNRAGDTVYAAQLGDEPEMRSHPIGPGCRLCERSNCPERSQASNLFASEQSGERAIPALLGVSWHG